MDSAQKFSENSPHRSVEAFATRSPPPSYLLLLRSEIPSGKCAKLRTVAASNNRVHPTRSLNYCLFVPHIYGVVLRTHPVRGESCIQRNANREVATLSCHLHLHTYYHVTSSFILVRMQVLHRNSFAILCWYYVIEVVWVIRSNTACFYIAAAITFVREKLVERKDSIAVQCFSMSPIHYFT